jgi:nucleoside-diphosphate-sugar epimerase
MRVLLIGGNGFIGPHVAAALERDGHDVVLFHRRPSANAARREIVGDRQRIYEHRDQLRALGADVVVDLILSSGRQARELIEVFRGAARRIVAISSCDVYRACGVLHGSEPGPLEPVPLTEASPLRTKLQTYPPDRIKMLQQVFGWLDDEYDKIPVEREILADPRLPGTVLRLPMVYGPGDALHRLMPIVKRVADGRRVILLEEKLARWRAPRGYVENVAAVAGWTGEFVLLPADRMPAHLLMPGNTEQHWSTDTTRIRTELGYREPIAQEEAIRRTIEWERANPTSSSPHAFDYPAEDAALAHAI